MSKGVLLVNLGSPDSPSVSDVRRYLREFLMDGRVLDAAWPIRFAVVHFAILPKRPKESAEAYHKIWTPEGSPLVVTSQHVTTALRARVKDLPIELAMRYQNPSIPDALRKLAAQGVTELFLIPLFPHYAMSSFETAVVRVQEVARKLAPQMRIDVMPPYYADDDYISALAASAADFLSQPYDQLLFSFHGIPERHLRISDPTCERCLQSDNCCEGTSPAHDTCYRAHCFKTVEAFVRKAGVTRYSVSFQSRLGRDPWLRPYTDHVLEELPKQGVKNLLVICPAFVSDCLETIEEIGMRGRDSFLGAGGEKFAQIPCLNEHPRWIAVLEQRIRDFAAGKASDAQKRLG